MSEKPILFSGEMVRATLDGRKGNTRRIVKGSEDCEGMDRVRDRKGVFYRGWWSSGRATQSIDFEPLVQPGDTLWVRESWQRYAARDATCIVVYRADGQARAQYNDYGDAGDPVRVGEVVTDHDLPMCWRPSIHMPRWACRLRLKVTGVRVERVQDITEEDAIAEGSQAAERVCDFCGWNGTWDELEEVGKTEDSHPCPRCKEDTDGWYLDEQYRKGFQYLWQSINGPESWAANPWVWVYEFEPEPQP